VVPGLVVKIVNKSVGDGKFYKAKGVVASVLDKYVAIVRVVDESSGKSARLQVDQEDLETVIPKVGAPVRIVNGRGRGAVAELLEMNTDDFCVNVRITEGVLEGEVLKRVEYEDVCKIDV
jgi:DNA/RNA-binding protein KIN17